MADDFKVSDGIFSNVGMVPLIAVLLRFLHFVAFFFLLLLGLNSLLALVFLIL